LTARLFGVGFDVQRDKGQTMHPTAGGLLAPESTAIEASLEDGVLVRQDRIACTREDVAAPAAGTKPGRPQMST
jgi:hypothetical protein